MRLRLGLAGDKSRAVGLRSRSEGGAAMRPRLDSLRCCAQWGVLPNKNEIPRKLQELGVDIGNGELKGFVQVPVWLGSGAK